MKRTLVTLALITLATTKSFAHYLWIETNANGQLGIEQQIKIYFGEYTYGIVEPVMGKAFSNVKAFNLWVVDGEGKKTTLKASPQENHYLATFTPKTNGTHTVILNNDHIGVIDYTAYNFGIFKTHYHSTAKFQVGKKANETVALNKNGITIKDVSKTPNQVKLQVLYKNAPLAKNEVKVFISDLWSKTLETDENGYVSFKLPWKTKYLIETTKKEEVPGTFKGEDYEFIWHCATYTIL